ncbi:MAG: TIGR01777 family oxidoreductase [Desulfobacterales bacterium]|nr:TIGR01777 family oxidoreductase [Desulfobacterales bacterium]
MKILVTGATGFIGRHLSNLLLFEGHSVSGIGTRTRQDLITHENFNYISGDTTQPGAWQEALADVDAVINLAGKSIFSRWSERYKKSIYDSRILTTRNLVEALPENKAVIFCSTSATGFYGDGGDDILTESSPGGDDFLARVGKDWEAEALRAGEKGARVVLTRFGIVLGKQGGMMQKVLPPFRFFIGGPLGDGTQWFPWIHMDDLLAAFGFVLKNDAVKGPLNFCSPNPVRNLDFTKSLGRVLNRPVFMRTPSLLLRFVMGELAGAVLCSQRAVPEKLLGFGFRFKYPGIEDALANITSL